MMNRAISTQRTFPCTLTRVAGPAVKKDDPIIKQAIADGKRVAAEKVERQAALERNTQTILSQISGLPPERLGELVRE